MHLFLILLRTSRRLAVLTILFGALSGASSAALLGLINNALTRSTSELSGLALPFAAMALAALVTRVTSPLAAQPAPAGHPDGPAPAAQPAPDRHLLRTLEEAAPTARTPRWARTSSRSAWA